MSNIMVPTTISVRNVDSEVFRKFKARSQEKGLNLGHALTLAVSHWSEEHKSRKRFVEFKPSDLGKGTEKTSTESDTILYNRS